MTFKEIIDDLAKESGLPLELDNNESCMLESDDIVITVQHRNVQDDVVIFAPVTDPDKIARLNESVLRSALSLSYNGVATGGCYMGQYEESLVLTKYISAQNLTSEILAMQINDFSRIAADVRDTILNAYQDIPAVEISDGGVDNYAMGLSV
jgi:hypothetical protein